MNRIEKTKTLNNITIQSNGIIRDEFNMPIGKLFNDQEFDDIRSYEIEMNNKKSPERNFIKEITGIINSFSKENDSDTPDFILAEYLNRALDNFAETTQKREKWYNIGNERK